MNIKRFIVVFLALISLQSNVYASSKTSLDELQDLELIRKSDIKSGKAFNEEHWAYISLQNLTKKYGFAVDDSKNKFDNGQALTRREAALLLVNLLSKIQEGRVEVSQDEKTEIKILKNELTQEITNLSAEIAKTQASVQKLEGRVAVLEGDKKNNDDKVWFHDYAGKYKMSGSLGLMFNRNFNKGLDKEEATNFKLDYTDLYFSGDLSEKLDYTIGLSPDRLFSSSDNSIVYDTYVGYKLDKNNKLYFGQMRTPIGYEGSMSRSRLETLKRSQISREFGDKRDVGLKLIGDYKKFDYYLGVFNGNGQKEDEKYNENLDAGGWLVYKPIINPNGHNLSIGGGYYAGQYNDALTHDNISHNNLGAYVGYKYKKHDLAFEWAQKTGYKQSHRKADGWYVNYIYEITDRFEVLAKYDMFNPNSAVSQNTITEYTLGCNYYFLPQKNVKASLNFIYDNNKAGANSSKVLMRTQYLF